MGKNVYWQDWQGRVIFPLFGSRRKEVSGSGWNNCTVLYSCREKEIQEAGKVMMIVMAKDDDCYADNDAVRLTLHYGEASFCCSATWAVYNWRKVFLTADRGSQTGTESRILPPLLELLHCRRGPLFHSCLFFLSFLSYRNMTVSHGSRRRDIYFLVIIPFLTSFFNTWRDRRKAPFFLASSRRGNV